jgi:SagB-type dehydrogenase family enzyme
MNELSAQENQAIGKKERLDMLIIITARFGRVNWQYESIAYSLILKNVGVIYQTFYLVATAMGLAPCALGAGNSDFFSSLAGLNYFEETSVGEFLLGIEK